MKKGFTLIEILVVLVVIGILVAVILPNTLRAIDQANVKKTAAELRNIDTALNLCYSHLGVWTSCNSLALLSPAAGTQYMEPIPTGADAFAVPYVIIADPNGTGGWISQKTTHFPSWPALTPHIDASGASVP